MVGSLYMAVNPPPGQPKPPPPPLGSRLAQLSPDIGAGVLQSIVNRGSNQGSQQQIQHERDMLLVVQQRLRAEQQILDIQGRLTNARRDQYSAALQDARLLDNNLRAQERIANMQRIGPNQSMHQNLAAYEMQYGRAPGIARGAVGLSSAAEMVLQRPGQALSMVMRGGGMLAGRAVGGAIGGAAEALGGVAGAGAQGALLGSIIGGPIGTLGMAALAATLTQLPAAIRHMTETENIFRRQGPTPDNQTAESLYELRNRGIGFGYNVDQTLAVSQQMAAGGMMQGNRLTADRLASVMQFSRMYGVNPEETGGFVGQMNRMGVGQGDTGTRNLANQLAFAIRQGNMGGRESEVIQSLQTLAQSMAARGVAPDVGRIGAVQNILNAGQNPLLRGEYGATALQNLGAGIQGATGYQQAFLYSLARRANPNLTQIGFSYDQELGAQSPYMPEYLRGMYEKAGGNLDTAGFFTHMFFPQVSMHQGRALVEAYSAANQQGRRLTSADIQGVMEQQRAETGITGAEVPLHAGETIERTTEQARSTFEGFAVGLAQSGSKLIDIFNQLGDEVKRLQQTLADPNAVVSSIISGNQPGPQIPGAPQVVIPNPGAEIGKRIREGIGMPEGVIPHAAAPGIASAAPEDAPPAVVLPPPSTSPVAPPEGTTPGIGSWGPPGALIPQPTTPQPETVVPPEAVSPPESVSPIAPEPGTVAPPSSAIAGPRRTPRLLQTNGYECGPTTAAMFINGALQTNYTGHDVTQMVQDLGFQHIHGKGGIDDIGIRWNVIPAIINRLASDAGHPMRATENYTNPREAGLATLRAGNPIMFSANRDNGAERDPVTGTFTYHIMGAEPAGNGMYHLLDPAQNYLPNDQLLSEAGVGRLIGGASWSINNYNNAITTQEAPSSSPIQGQEAAPEESASVSPISGGVPTVRGIPEGLQQHIPELARAAADAGIPLDLMLTTASTEDPEGGLLQQSHYGEGTAHREQSYGLFQMNVGGELGKHSDWFSGLHDPRFNSAYNQGRAYAQYASPVWNAIQAAVSRGQSTYQGFSIRTRPEQLALASVLAEKPLNPSPEPYLQNARNIQIEQNEEPPQSYIHSPMIGQNLAASQQMMSVSFNNPTVTIQLPDGTVVGSTTLTPFEDTLNAVDRRTRAGFGGVTM